MAIDPVHAPARQRQSYSHRPNSPGSTTPGSAQKRRVVPAGRAASCSPTRRRMCGLAAHGSAVTVRVVSSRVRSEERRVGKACGGGGAAGVWKKREERREWGRGGGGVVANM